MRESRSPRTMPPRREAAPDMSGIGAGMTIIGSIVACGAVGGVDRLAAGHSAARSRSPVPRSGWCSASTWCGCDTSASRERRPLTTMLDQAYQPPAAPPTTIQNVILANLAVPIALIALPVFLATGKPFNAWAIATGLWLVNRLLQAGVNRFIIGLPQTIAVATAGVTFISRAWGTLLGLVLTVHFAGKLGRAARCDPLRRAVHVRPHRPRHLLRQQPPHARGEAPVTLAPSPPAPRASARPRAGRACPRAGASRRSTRRRSSCSTPTSRSSRSRGSISRSRRPCCT